MASHVKVRSTRILKAWMVSLHNRLRPRVVVVRLRGCSLRLGLIPAWKMPCRLCAASKPPSRLREAPLRSHPTLLAIGCKGFHPVGTRTRSVSLTGATGRGANPEPWWSVMALPFSPCWCLSPAEPMPSPLFGPRGWSRRRGGYGGQGAWRPRDAPHEPQRRARALRHRPIWRRLCRRSCRAWPVSQWRLLVQVGTSTASLCRVPTR